MRVIALLATYNERRFVAACLDHLIRNGIDVYLVDNESTDETVAIAERFLGHGLIAIEKFPHPGFYDWQGILSRKERLAQQLDADWFVHVDADEILLSPRPGESLRDALGRVDGERFNAVNFFEFTFVPTVEAPDHDHPDYQKTMLNYYPFSPAFPRLVRAWKRQDGRVDLTSSAGHLPGLADQRLAAETFNMRHYLFLSRAHLVEKYIRRRYSERELKQGWHKWRASIDETKIVLPRQQDLRRYLGDDKLDWSSPRRTHILQDMAR